MGPAFHDALGSVTRLENQGTFASSSDYLVGSRYHDAAGRRTRIVHPDARIDAYLYAALGGPTRLVQDESGIARVSDSAYARTGRMTRLTGYKDGSSDAEATDYPFDLGSRLTKTTYPDAGAVTRYYDQSGAMTASLDARGITTRYGYSLVGRRTCRQDAWSSPDVVESWHYSQGGDLTLARKGLSGDLDDSAQAAMFYNAFGQLTRSEQAVEETTAKTVAYFYSNSGDRTKLDYPSNSMDFGFAFDQNGRVTQIKDNSGTVVTEYTYAAQRVAKRRYPVPDVDRDLSYDQLARSTRISQQKVTGSTDLASYGYWYDRASGPTRQQFVTRSGDPSSAYEYDVLNRLTYALYFDSSTNGTSSFLYDDVANRTYHLDRSANAVTYLHNLVNEYTKIGAAARSHDAAGNLTDDGTYTYEWDYQNRLTRIERNSDSGTVAVFEHDALSRRVVKYDAVADSTLRFYYSDEDPRPQPFVASQRWGNWRCIEEYDTSATPVRQRHYLHGPSYVDEMIYLGNDVGDNTGTFYALEDHLFTTMALVNTSGSVVERYRYDGYGNVEFEDSSFSPLASNSSLYGNTLTFTGRRLDQFDDLAHELIYGRARYYDSEYGRFLSRDQPAYVDEVNLYAYGDNAPPMWADPSGATPTNPTLPIPEGCPSEDLENSLDWWAPWNPEPDVVLRYAVQGPGSTDVPAFDEYPCPTIEGDGWACTVREARREDILFSSTPRQNIRVVESAGGWVNHPIWFRFSFINGELRLCFYRRKRTKTTITNVILGLRKELWQGIKVCDYNCNEMPVDCRVIFPPPGWEESRTVTLEMYQIDAWDDKFKEMKMQIQTNDAVFAYEVPTPPPDV